jgi:hypothetical protein
MKQRFIISTLPVVLFTMITAFSALPTAADGVWYVVRGSGSSSSGGGTVPPPDEPSLWCEYVGWWCD